MAYAVLMSEARSDLRSIVAAIPPLDARKEADIANTLAWTDLGALPWRTTELVTPPKHLVSCFLLVDGKHILLVDHLNAEL